MTIAEIKNYLKKHLKLIIIFSVMIGIIVACYGCYSDKKNEKDIIYCSQSEIYIKNDVIYDGNNKTTSNADINIGLLLADNVIKGIDNITNKDDIIIDSDESGQYLYIYVVNSSQSEAKRINEELLIRGSNNISKETNKKVLITMHASDGYPVEVTTIEKDEKKLVTSKQIRKSSINNQTNGSWKSIVMNGFVGLVGGMIFIIAWLMLWKLSVKSLEND